MGFLDDILGLILEILLGISGSQDKKKQPLILRIIGIAFFLVIVGFVIAAILNAFGIL